MMDALGAYLIKEILAALGEGALVKAAAFLAVFLVLWLELRSLRKAVGGLGNSVTQGFAAGEKRFESIETKQMEHEHRLTALET